MSKYLPPGAANDPNAPWNRPDPKNLLPLRCECGFVANTLDDLDGHEHPDDWFVRCDDGREEPEPCAVCNPIDGCRKPGYGPGMSLRFCDDHCEDDLQEAERNAHDYMR